MKITFLFGFLLLATTFWAQTPAGVTEHGYRFYHHINKGGQKPKRGETIRAYVNVFIGDTLLSSSRKNLGGTYKFDIAPEGSTLNHYPPMMDAALLMGIGDSATVFQPLDSAMRQFVPKAVQHLKELRFEIALVQIISMEDKFKAEQAFAARAAIIKQTAEEMVLQYMCWKLGNAPDHHQNRPENARLGKRSREDGKRKRGRSSTLFWFSNQWYLFRQLV